MRPVLFLAALWILSACVAGSVPVLEANRTVDRSFLINTSGWTGGADLRFTVAFDIVRGEAGNLICGAYGYNTNILQGPTSNMMRGGAVLLDDVPVIDSLSFFARHGGVRDEDGIVGRTANCVPLPPHPPGGGSVSLSFGSGNFAV